MTTKAEVNKRMIKRIGDEFSGILKDADDDEMQKIAELMEALSAAIVSVDYRVSTPQKGNGNAFHQKCED